LQSFKNTFLRKNLNQNVPKSVIFSEKPIKIAAALEAPLSNPC